MALGDLFLEKTPALPAAATATTTKTTITKIAVTAILLLIVAYLVQLNRQICGTPEEVRRLAPARWTEEVLRDTYRRIRAHPVTTKSYAGDIPPKLRRRYIVTGGSGLVGGHIVLQLLERGQPPSSIRIVDFQPLHRADMLTSAAAEVEFVQTDISSAAATDAAFALPWADKSVASLPLTVFHTAAVIVPSERSPLAAGFCEAVNVRGTQHVLGAARRAGADVLVSTTSGSISILPVRFWRSPWRVLTTKEWPAHFWQVLDSTDFFRPLRRHDRFFANYPASKAAAERIVCAANSPALRTGCIRPCNGVYGHPTDNTVGGSLGAAIQPQWTSHFFQSFVHGANVALAHLQFEAVLDLHPYAVSSALLPPQSGRPFCVTDPNPPITFGDVYTAVGTLVITPYRTLPLQPIFMLLAAHVVEWYALLLLHFPCFRAVFPVITSDLKHLQPALFSITTHLVATNEEIGKSVGEGGLGYKGVVTTLDGMVQEIVEWNQEHENHDATADADAAVATNGRKVYRSSVSLAGEMQQRLASLSKI